MPVIRRCGTPLACAALLALCVADASASSSAAADYLARANAAFAANRTVAPQGDNALEWTLAAQAVEPQSERVREGLNDLYPLVVTAIDRRITTGDTAEALRLIVLLETAMPSSIAARKARARLGAPAGSTRPALAFEGDR